MSRIAYCAACAAHNHGVKTRIALEHTCGLNAGETPQDQHEENAYRKWKEELISVTSEKTGRPAYEIKINDDGAKKWFNSGATPYQTFRETYSNENDSE